MSEHLHDTRQKIHKLASKYPEVASHFGLSHAGLIDNETEKLVEIFSFLLTESEAYRKSILANKIKPFMEVLFPEWYRPEVSSCIAEFNNYEEFENFTNIMELEDPITFECEYEGKSIYLSANPGFPLVPFSIEKSYFTATETLTHMHFYFKRHVDDEEYIKNSKIKIYLNSTNHEEILSLIHFIFEPQFKDKKYLFKTQDKEIELDRSSISLPLIDLKNTKQNVFFESKNKLSIFMDVLNKLHHYLYIEIDLSNFYTQYIEEFSIHIPLNKNAYSEFCKMERFAKTNCIPVFDVYKKSLKNITILKTNNDNTIKISELKNDGLINIRDSHIINFETNNNEDLPNGMHIENSIQFAPSIPYNLEHNLIFNDSFSKQDTLFISKGIYTQFLKDTSKIKENTLKITGASNTRFGNVLSHPTQTIFYSEILSDSHFFNFIYNWNYFIGKKMDNLTMVLEYVEKISPLFFNYKESFIKYFSEIEIKKWKMVAKMGDKGNPLIISRYQLKKTNNKCNYFFDRILEKILDNLAETDLVYEIVRV